MRSISLNHGTINLVGVTFIPWIMVGEFLRINLGANEVIKIDIEVKKYGWGLG
jgi:hypothetical protein